MLMSRKIWLVLAISALVAVSFAASVVAARKSTENRVRYVTRGLDYLHARQGDTGGFGSPGSTAWAVLGAVASGERMGSSAWTVKGKNAFDSLETTDIVAQVSAASLNAPETYAQLMMAYIAMGKANSIAAAGSKDVNLVTLLLSYQNTVDGSPTKGAIVPRPTSTFDAAVTTSWAILALHNYGTSPSDPSFRAAATWLAAQQNVLPGDPAAYGGFPTSVVGDASNPFATALAYQALTVSSDGTDWDPAAARSFLRTAQKSSGGFPATPGGDTDAEATATAVQAILAMGEHPEDADWTVGTNTPISALESLLETNGSYRLTARSHLRPVTVTGWVLVALNRKPFTTYPKNPGNAHTAFKFRPLFKSVSPKNGAKFKSHVVLIRATYTDFYPKGTGIKPSAVRLYVDSQNKTRPADIGRYGLHLQLKNVPNGDHTYKIELRDNAGNTKAIERKFVVAVPTPVPTHTPTTRPTYYPTVYPTVYPTRTPTPKPYTTVTPTPYQTVTPYPYDSPTASASPLVTGSPVPSPSTSASPAGAGGSGGGGSAAGFVGGTLLAMLPIGAVVSYLLLHRREELLGTASQGTVLAGGGSPWQRFKQTLARSKDLTRPSSRE
jgi:hypothetical protein